MLQVWQASAVRGEELGLFHEVADKCIVTAGSLCFMVDTLTVDSGVARTSPLLGHSMGTLRLYELPHKVQKLIVGSRGILPPKI